MNKIDLTYRGKLKASLDVIDEKELDILYTVDGESGDVTTLSIKINNDPLSMITFNYQDLKKIVGDVDENK